LIIDAHGPVRVVVDGHEVGVVGSEDVLALVAGDGAAEPGH
jgi:hypothetical protein